MNWNLDDFYLGFDDPKYQDDINKLQKLIDEYNQLKDLMKTKDELNVLLTYIKINQEIVKTVRTLSSFNSLINATDVSNQQSLVNMAKISRMLNEITSTSVLFTRYLSSVDLDKYRHNDIILDNLFQLQKEKESAKYLLTEKEEVLYSKLRQLSSSSWSQLQSLLTSKLDVSFNNENITLSEARNLAYDNDPSVRKNAYEAELKAYEKIDEVAAMALSNIKREVVTINDLRGYKNVLEPTLLRSNMKEETLNAMIEAMLEFRPYFANYLKAKAKYLNHDNGLPFYDLFAPVGKLDKTYSYQEAQDIIIKSFNSYSPKLGSYAKKAFDLNWIDPFPKKGKKRRCFL